MSSDGAACVSASYASHGTGPLNANTGAGKQVNPTISGGENNVQNVADTQNFFTFGFLPPDDPVARFRKCLFLTDPSIDRKDLIKIKGERVPGTCEWIEENEIYQHWLCDDTKPLLWIWGGPGKGKTMLSIHLSQIKERDTQTIYYFCAAGDDKRNTATAVLRGLLWRLTGLFPSAVATLQKDYDLNNLKLIDAILSSPETLWSILVDLVTQVRPGRMFCVLDGLDECDEDSQRWLVGKLSTLPSGGYGDVLKVVLISRRMAGLKDMPQVKLDSDSRDKVSLDVQKFVHMQVQRLSEHLDLNSEIRTHLSHVGKDLVKRAQESFLWVGFAVTELWKENTITGLLDSLNNLPPDLFSVYERIVRKIKPRRRSLCMRILGWVALARRPLSLDEIACGIICQPANVALTIGQSARDCITECGPMINVRGEMVSFVHDSVRDYLLQRHDGTFEFSDEFRIDPKVTNLDLAGSCLRAIEQGTVLSEYADRHWPSHVKSSEESAKDLIENARYFFDYNSELSTAWWCKRLKGNNSIDVDKDWAMLHVACHLGLELWVADILKSRTTRLLRRRLCNEQDKTGRTPLYCAAAQGYPELVEYLLDVGADASIKNHEGHGPAQVAASRGRGAVLEALFKHDPMLLQHNIQDCNGWSLLHRAANQGHTEVVRLLLERGANPDQVDQDSWLTSIKGWLVRISTVTGLKLAYPFASATEYEYESTDAKIARLSAECSANLRGWTALHVAAKSGHEATVHLLLERGADINKLSRSGQRTALQLAATDNHESVVRLLLERGADVDDRHGGRTALHLAIDEGTDVRRELMHEMWKKAKPGSLGAIIFDPGFTTRKCPLAVVRLLLRYGADANAEDREGCTILESTVERGIGEVIKLLILHGATVESGKWDSEVQAYMRFCVRETQSYGYLLSRSTQPTSRSKMSRYVCAV